MKHSSMSLPLRIQILLNKELPWLTGWQRSHYNAVLVELARNLPSETCQKSALYCARESYWQKGVLPEAFCYKPLQGVTGASFSPWDACVSSTLQYLSIGEAESTVEAWSWRSCQHCRRQKHSSTKPTRETAWGWRVADLGVLLATMYCKSWALKKLQVLQASSAGESPPLTLQESA